MTRDKPPPTPKPPKHLSKPLAAIWSELAPTLTEFAPLSIIEALAVQTKTLRDARAAIDADGLIVRDVKQNAVEHPALAIERAAIAQIHQLNKEWAR